MGALNIVCPVVLHIPHSSAIIPPEVRSSIVLSDEDLAQELIRMTDRYTDEIFDVDPKLASRLVFPASRLVADVERFVDAEVEPMAARGMGCIYRRTSEGKPLRIELSDQAREELLNEYYRPHHQELSAMVTACLAVYDSCLIVDCHSFSSIPLPHEVNQKPDRPEICVGADDFHTPSNLMDRTIKLFEKAGFRTLLNQPFAGSIVPKPFYLRDGKVKSIMIEVNRQQYMDEASGQKLPVFEVFKKRVRDVLAKIIKTAQ